MNARSRAAPIPWSALFFALLGLAWCGYIAFPTGQPPSCSTSGCYLFRDGKVAGISLWWVGGAYFFLLAIVCLRGARRLAWNLARLALFLDSILLLLMFFTAPCFDCMVAAVFFGLTYFCLRPTPGGWFLEEPSPLLLLPLWFGLFLGNSCQVLNETVPLMTLGPSNNPNVRIYFSPSCPPCRDAVNAFGETSTLIPVREREGDVESIVRLKTLLQDGVSLKEALARSIAAKEELPPVPMREHLLVAAQLVRNKAMALRHGFTSLPLIQVNGMPAKAKPATSESSVSGPPGRPEARPEVERPSYPPQETQLPPENETTPEIEGEAPPAGSLEREYSAPPQADSRPYSEEPSLSDFLEDLTKLEQCSQASGKPCPE